MTRKHELPDDVRRFILTSIPSVPYLEAMLLLRQDPARGWAPAELARRIYVSEREAAAVLEQLEQRGVAGRLPAGGTLLHFVPASAELQARLAELADAYAHNLVGVTDVIHSRVDRRATQFADAFRIKKE